MEPDRTYTLKHNSFGEIATFQRLPLDDGGVRFRVTAPTWWHGNLASEWLRRKMEESGLFPDQKHERSFPKWCRCHSRKRYMKLLMADGFSRHAAALWCGFVETTRRIRKGNFSYQEAWHSYIFSTMYIEVEESPDEE